LRFGEGTTPWSRACGAEEVQQETNYGIQGKIKPEDAGRRIQIKAVKNANSIP